ncbi:MAG: hypothetical protein ACRD50_09600 [Candidatus Acidiferrales bacterium]
MTPARHSRVRLARICPSCQSLDVRRSHRKGLLETFVLPFLLLRPYRCNECQNRHINFIFSRRISVESNKVTAEE